MRIVICDYSGHPFQIELSRCLAQRKHDMLHLHFAEFQTPKGELSVSPDDAPTFALESVSLGRPFDQEGFVRRRSQEMRVGRLMASRALRFRPNLVVGCNMPLDAQAGLHRACTGTGVTFVFWLQDIYSAAINHQLGVRLRLAGRMVGRYYQRLEGRLLRSSDAVVAISESFLPPLKDWRVPRERIAVIPNWAPLSHVHPVEKPNEWARRHGLHDKTVALYTGTLGLRHDPALLLDLARAGAASGLHVVVASEGRAARWLKSRAEDYRIDNLTILPFQPMNLYPHLLGAGDVLLAILGAEAAFFSVPSKILSYLAAGKPVVAAIAGDNDVAKIIGHAGAGIITPPGDSAAFIRQVLALTGDPPLRQTMGDNGRNFAERHFAIAVIADRFESVFRAALARRRSASPVR